MASLPGIAQSLVSGIGAIEQGNASETASQNQGLKFVEQFGVFGQANQATLAEMANATFANQSPASLAALSLDEPTGLLSDALQTQAPISNTLPLIGIGIGILGLFLALRK